MPTKIIYASEYMAQNKNLYSGSKLSLQFFLTTLGVAANKANLLLLNSCKKKAYKYPITCTSTKKFIYMSVLSTWCILIY